MLASAYRSKEVIDAGRLGGAAGRRRGEGVRRLTLQEPIHAQKFLMTIEPFARPWGFTR
jgi:hypothetical protein